MEMYTTVGYNGRSYGNTQSANSFSVRVSKSSPPNEICLFFKYDKPVNGHAIGLSVGLVTDVSIRMKEQAAVALARAILMAHEIEPGSPIAFRVEEKGLAAGGEPTA